MYIILLLGVVYTVQCAGLDACSCAVKINSSTRFMQKLEQVNDIPLQNNCYVLELQEDIELTLNATINISNSMALYGNGATVKCNFLSNTFNYSALINVRNVSYFEINNITFVECPSSFRFHDVTTVMIRESHFRDFTQDPVYLFNCPSLSVINSTFSNNNSTARYLSRSFEANAAALSYGWNNVLLNTPSSINVYVYNCQFIVNTARGIVRDFDPTTDALETRTFAGRGGGMAVVLNVTSNVTVVVEETMFIENHANGFGGGFYLLIDGISLNQHFILKNNVYKGNTATFGGAAINVGYLSIIPDVTINQVIIKDSKFISNNAGFVGAIGLALTYIYGVTNFIQIINCSFYSNVAGQYGAAIGLFHLDFLSAKTEVQPVEITDCEFVENICGSGGILGVAYFPISLNGNISFVNSAGPALRVVSSVVHVKGARLTFLGNNAEGFAGGAMYLTAYTQVILSQGSTFDFINNTGSIGASVVVETQAVPQLFLRTAFNQLCFLQYEQSTEQTFKLPPEEWKEVILNFAGNTAIVGSAMYIDRLDLCSWNSKLHPFFSLDDTLRWSFVHYNSRLSNQNTGHRNASDDRFNLQTPVTTFVLNKQEVSSYPGQSTLINLTAYDELNHLTAAVFQIDSLESNSNKADIFQFNPSAYLYKPIDDVLTLQYGVSKVSSFKRFVGTSVTSDSVSGTLRESFNLSVKSCQPGYRLQQSTETKNSRNLYTCLCDDNVSIRTCRGDNIILKNGLWGHYTGNELFFYHCPLGYCRCRYDPTFGTKNCLAIYTVKNESLQCDCNREGLLCGSCKEGKGVSTLLNNCKSCVSVGWLLIIILVAANVSVTVVVVMRDLKLPKWTYPFLYYIQVMPYVLTNLTFSFSEWNNYLYYFSSVLGLYFPYDFCLFNGMDVILSYWLRYIPVIITSSVCVTLLIIYKKCTVTRWKYSWSGVWTLLLLQYPSVIHTSMSILNCPVIPLQDGDNTGKWYIDASVQCFHGTHAAIGTIAIVLLIVAVLLVPTVGLIGCGILFKIIEQTQPAYS
ncbi:uncharacterized protein [Dysidea avara]|uniref:uncharacterized protein isoform X3 n=1 Tax=Dysidea avara TaxID=196820 RepID=UPI0033223024